MSVLEYRVEVLGGGLRSPKPEELEALLNRAAEDGWRLEQVLGLSNSQRLFVVLRRGEGETEQASVRRRPSWAEGWGMR